MDPVATSERTTGLRTLAAIVLALLLTATACAAPAPQDTPAAPGDTPAAPGDTPAAPGDTPAAPGDTPAPTGGSLRIVYDTEPPTFDPWGTPIQSMHFIGYHIYEGLFTVNQAVEPVPMLAEDYSYDPDTRTATITIRQGVLFHNGQELTADDVVASLELWGEITPYGQPLFERNVVELRKVDDYTIELELREHSGIIPFLLAYPHQQAMIMPASIIEGRGDDILAESDFIGTGPYQWAEFAPGQHVRLTRFEDYVARDDEPDGLAGRRDALLDELMFMPVPEVQVRMDMLARNEADFVLFLSPEMHDEVSANPDLVPIIKRPDRSAFIPMNKAWGPMTDVRIRQAFAIALDMDEIMGGAFGDQQFWRTDPSMIFAEYEFFHSTAGAEDIYNQADPDRARALLEEAGYDGEPIIWLTTAETPWGLDVATVAVEQLQEAGFVIDLRVTDFATIASVRNTKEGEWHVFSNNTSPTPEPGIYPLFDSEIWGWWVDERKDQLVDQLNAEFDPDSRKVIWDELQAYIWETVTWLKVGDYFGLAAHTNGVQGYNHHQYPYWWGVTVSD